MANDNIKKIKTTEIQIEDEKLQKVRETNEKLNQITNAFGQAHLRKNDIEKTISSLEEQFDSLNTELQEALSSLEKEYPRGNLDLQSGVLTINEEVVEEVSEEK